MPHRWLVNIGSGNGFVPSLVNLTSEFLRYSPQGNFTASARADILYNKFEKYTFEIIATTPRG